MVMTTKKEKDSGTPKVRVQFDFSKESLDKLDELVSTLSAATRAEVIRRALTLFTEVVDADRRGAKIYIREPDGEMVRLMPLL